MKLDLFCKCGRRLEYDDAEQRAACPSCTPKQGRLPFKRKSKGQSVHPSEEVVQGHIMAALTALGYTVLSTSEHRKAEQCPHCQGWVMPRQGRGCTPGVPDLLVTTGPHRAFQWPVGVLVGLEVKGHRTAVSAEQQYLAEQGRITIVKSVDEAVAAVEAAEQVLQQIPNTIVKRTMVPAPLRARPPRKPERQRRKRPHPA